MTTLRNLRLAAAAVSLLALAAACAQDGTASETGDTPGAGAPASYGDDDLVLRVDYTGGFTTPTMQATRLPALSVYGDGRVITEGPQIMIYPGPALPNLQVRRISPADVDRLAELALDAGVGSGLDFGEPPVADAAATRFTVLTQVGPQVSEVYALQESEGADGGLTEEQITARTAMRKLFADLTDLPGTLGAEAVTEEGPYQPTALAAVAEPWVAGDDELGEQPEIQWPGPALPGDVLNADLGLHCVTITGDAATEVVAAAAEATTATPWLSGDERWLVTLRPLLPDETSCADLQG